MTTKKLKSEFSDKEIESWVQNFRQMMKEDPDPNEEVFPNDMNEVNAYIHTLEDLVKKNATQQLKEDLRVYKAFKSGSFNGYATATEYLMKRSDEIQQVSKEDKKANDLLDKKLINWLEEEHKKNPDKMISKKEILKKAKLTKKELKAAGIVNAERYSFRKIKND